ncbi:filamentation induced by cAMP protein fic [Clostridium botulinum]|uniref:Filamentation induced by cAMP protein fic n=1 Tax=Clostridium botulinum TaxID=1491 RepID=A0A6B4FK89_CLOBO|nr:Fic family protein [Clostridium botulinum]KAI3345642.1 Fic family protein [Clostridium botulinum]MBN1049292.1 filamentation induced by cAMP protein fic [Clostridium botulinum]MCS6110234.1 filamentation induced by cAMP protein fic [Clostridium botulinum]NFE12460.1 filamentation induced by cAMP protein fic [Clostridium botulinum]NFE58615.1 filamentation induced by cAMP protein fic [Clostridium botulinum]
MLFERSKSFEDIMPKLDTNKLIILVKNLLPDVVFNMASLEGNPFTYPEVQTLLDGITIGGHKLSDEQQILRIRDGWNFLFEKIRKKEVQINLNLFNDINGIIAKDEALISGSFRTGGVRIGGTDFIPPAADELEDIFNKELELIIERCESSTELAFEIFLWGALNQFYYDGNKRTSRLVANLILISNGQGIFNVKVKDRLEFNTLMVEFYNTRKVEKIMEFFYKKCLERY